MTHRFFFHIFAGFLSLVLMGCTGNPRHVVPSPRVDAPPPGKAVVNFFYDYGTEKNQSIFNEKKELLFLIAPRTVHQVAVDPGEHIYFVGIYIGGFLKVPGVDGKIKITAKEGRIYDVYLTVNFGNYTQVEPAHPGTSYHDEVAPLLATLQTVSPLDRTIPEIKEREESYYPVLGRFFKLMDDGAKIIPREMKAEDSRTK